MPPQQYIANDLRCQRLPGAEEVDRRIADDSATRLMTRTGQQEPKRSRNAAPREIGHRVYRDLAMQFGLLRQQFSDYRERGRDSPARPDSSSTRQAATLFREYSSRSLPTCFLSSALARVPAVLTCKHCSERSGEGQAPATRFRCLERKDGLSSLSPC